MVPIADGAYMTTSGGDDIKDCAFANIQNETGARGRHSDLHVFI
jgi:hypothetical protein